MQRKLKAALFTLSIIVALLLLPQVVAAKEEPGEANFSARAEIPENQVDKNQTYFDLRMQPGMEQDLTLVLTNPTKEKVSVTVEPNVATTNQNGEMDFTKRPKKQDNTLQYPFTELISDKQVVELASNETKNVTFKLKMPQEKIEGMILGGFYLYKNIGEEEEKAEANVQIKNRYSYVIGAKLTVDDQKVKPDVVLNEIKPDLLNYRTVVTANLQNIKPTMIGKFKVEAKIYQKGKTEVLHETTKENMTMAPNSNFDFPINWDNQRLEPGKYQLKLHASSNDENWEFDKEFTIEKTDSDRLNKEAVELEEQPMNWYLIIGIGLVIIVFLVVCVVVYKKNKKKKESLKRKKGSKKRKKKIVKK